MLTLPIQPLIRLLRQPARRWKLALAGLLLGLLPLYSQAQAPSNDLCTNATTLIPATTCTTTSGTVGNATATLADGKLDVWYSFTAVGSEYHIVVVPDAAASVSPVTVVFAGCPNNASVPVSYNSSSSNTHLTGLTTGQTYQVRIYDFYNNPLTPADGAFTICVTKPFLPTPANDLCSSPQVIVPAMPCTSTNGTVGGALADPNLDESDDVWYSFVATSSQHNILVTPTSGASLYTEVYTNTCPTSASTPLFHNASSSNTLATGLAMGTTYLVRVAHIYSGTDFLSPAAGAFTICIDDLSTAPANDECATAIGLGIINSTCTPSSGTLFGATQSGVSGGAGTADDDVWYSFVATNARAGVYLTNTGGLDLVVDLRGGACASTSSIRYGNQAGSTTGTVDSVSVHNLTVGTTYFVRVYSLGSTPSTASNGTFTLCVTTPGVCAPPTSLNVTNITNTGADLNWTAGAAGVQYRVEYGPTGFTPGTGTVLTTGLTSATITGLTSATAYQFYVRQTCASTVSSVRVGPQAFSTTGLTTLNVSTTQTITGTYDIVHILPTGHATLGADFTVNVSMDVQDGGSLDSGCHAVVGTGSFTLAAGAHLYICDFVGIISSSSNQNGSIQVTGTRTFSDDASYTYNNSSTSQNTGDGLPLTVRDLEVNDGGNALSITNNVNIRRTLKLTNGDIDSNGQAVTLLSGPTGTALIDNTGGIVQGAIHAERYVKNTLNPGLGYRHFSAPVQGATVRVSQLATSGSSIVTNPLYNGATAAMKPTITPYPTVFSYDQTQVPAGGTAADFDQGWQSPASNAAPLDPMMGYTSQVSGGQTVTFSGNPNNGAQSVTALGRGASAQAGWHLLGNPYPAPLDWSTMTVGNSAANNLQNMNGSVYVFQTTGRYAGTYRSYQNGIGGDPIIASGQGFFVRTATAGQPGTVRMSNANRITTWTATNSTLYRNADQRPQLRLALAGAASIAADETTVYFEAGATPGPDARFDAYKLRNVGPSANIFSVVGPEEMSINGLAPLASAAVVVPLGLAVPQVGQYTLRADALQNFSSTTVFLRDALTGTLTNLSQQPAYTFTVAANALSSNTRFTVLFRPGAALANHTSLEATQVALFPNPAHRDFTLLIPALPLAKSVSAKLVQRPRPNRADSCQLPTSSTGLEARFDVSSLPAGVYSLRLQAAARMPPRSPSVWSSNRLFFINLLHHAGWPDAPASVCSSKIIIPMTTLRFQFRNLLLVAAISLISIATAVAQAPPGGGPQPGGGAAVTPIDGGASLLLASGVALGIKRLRRKKA